MDMNLMISIQLPKSIIAVDENITPSPSSSHRKTPLTDYLKLCRKFRNLHFIQRCPVFLRPFLSIFIVLVEQGSQDGDPARAEGRKCTSLYTALKFSLALHTLSFPEIGTRSNAEACHIGSSAWHLVVQKQFHSIWGKKTTSTVS